VRVFFDTSVLVAAIVDSHPMHRRSFPWLRRALNQEFEYLVAAHTALELFAVLSRLPVAPRISPEAAQRLVRANVVEPATMVALTSSEYARLVAKAAALGLSGGSVYDALTAHAAQRAHADRLMTLNLAHFERVWPDAGSILAVP